MQLNLNFHDHSILVSGLEGAVIKKLEEEFHFFLQDQESSVDTTIELFRELPPELPSVVATKVLETCTVYRMGSRRYIDYHTKALAIWDETEDSIRIYSLQSEELYELAFLAIHSILGSALDKKGLCRVHALGISLRHKNALVMLPSKGGKSTLLTDLLENPEIRIISDDMPLIDLQGQVHAFPSKISLEKSPEDGLLSTLKWTEFKRNHYPPKWTAGLSQLSGRIELQSQENKTYLIAGMRLSRGESILSPVSKWKMIRPLMEHMVLGFGLPQVLEMFLRFDGSDFLKLPYHALIRMICAFNLLRTSKCYYFYLGPDKAQNAKLLIQELYEP